MTYFLASFSKGKGKKGQIKIQQMAFVLVAIVIFFTMVSLFYFSIRYQSLQKDVETLREREVIETVRKMTRTTEFSWTVYDCASCIDLDKILVLQNRSSYIGFWKRTSFLQVVRVYPRYDIEECNKGVYPECNTITIVDEKKNIITRSTFVALCRYEASEDFNKCELGKIIMGYEPVE